MDNKFNALVILADNMVIMSTAYGACAGVVQSEEVQITEGFMLYETCVTDDYNKLEQIEKDYCFIADSDWVHLNQYRLSKFFSKVKFIIDVEVPILPKDIRSEFLSELKVMVATQYRTLTENQFKYNVRQLVKKYKHNIIHKIAMDLDNELIKNGGINNEK